MGNVKNRPLGSRLGRSLPNPCWSLIPLDPHVNFWGPHTHLSLQGTGQSCGWWVALVDAQVAWKSSTRESGALCVMICGISMKPKLCAGSWGVVKLFRALVRPTLVLAQEASSLTTSSALGWSVSWASVPTWAGQSTTAATMRMPVSSAQVSTFLGKTFCC